MAIIKAVSSKAGIGTAIDYVTKDEKTEQTLLSGLNCEPDTVKEEMQATKELWGKTDGRTYKHFVQSFAPDEKMDPAQAHQIACRFASERPEWKGFEVLIATHKDKKHIHTHFIVNSVSFEDGHKIQQSRADLKDMKNCSDRLCLEQGLHITEKGKTFSGEEREETTAFKKDTYQILKQAEQGKVQSYVQDIALAILEEKEKATSQQEFIDHMEQRGYKTDWKDNHKYITWTDLAREKAGEKACKIRNNKLEKYYNMPFGKEELEREFAVNARNKDIIDRAREQLNNRGTEENDIGTGADDIAAFIRGISARVRNAEFGREEREAERSRQRAEAERRAREAEQRAKEAEALCRKRSRSHDRGR
jgi:hypothetical protein